MVGTRPNFIKECSLNPAFRRRGVREILVHTGQHYDYQMSGLFFHELEIPKPDYLAEMPQSKGGARVARMIEFIEEILLEERPRACIITGDVDSTMAGAIAAAKTRIPVAHIEGGIRTGEMFNPEEINRRVADAISDLILTNCQSAQRQLIREGRAETDVFFTGDLMKDTLDRIRPSLKPARDSEPYILVTIHRAENVETRHNLAEILEALSACGRPVRFPIHPHTLKNLHAFGLEPKLRQAKNIQVSDPVGYLEFLELISNSSMVVTDSGGVRREAYLMGVPVVNVCNLVWFPEIREAGWKRVTGPDSKAILDAIEHFRPTGPRPDIFGDGHAAERIADRILERYG